MGDVVTPPVAPSPTVVPVQVVAQAAVQKKQLPQGLKTFLWCTCFIWGAPYGLFLLGKLLKRFGMLGWTLLVLYTSFCSIFVWEQFRAGSWHNKPFLMENWIWAILFSVALVAFCSILTVSIIRRRDMFRVR